MLDPFVGTWGGSLLLYTAIPQLCFARQKLVQKTTDEKHFCDGRLSPGLTSDGYIMQIQHAGHSQQIVGANYTVGFIHYTS